jgi:hypothetical protein
MMALFSTATSRTVVGCHYRLKPLDERINSRYQMILPESGQNKKGRKNKFEKE